MLVVVHVLVFGEVGVVGNGLIKEIGSQVLTGIYHLVAVGFLVGVVVEVGHRNQTCVWDAIAKAARYDASVDAVE